MSNKLFVGNLSFNTTENDLQDAFAAHGTVIEANLMMDRMTNRPRGFGFVTMSTPEEAQKAIAALNGREIDGRALTVNVAKPREERSGGGGGGGGGGRRDYGGGSGGGGGGGGGGRPGGADRAAGDRLPEVLALLDTALIWDGEYLPAMVRYSAVLAGAGRFDEAQQWLERAEDLDPYWAPVQVAHADLIAARTAAGELDAVRALELRIAHYQRALQVEDDLAERASLNARLRNDLAAHGLVPEAIGVAEEYAAQGPTISTYLRDRRDEARAFALEQRAAAGHAAATLDAFAELVAARPFNYGLRAQYADALAAAGRHSEASAVLEESQRILESAGEPRVDYAIRIAAYQLADGRTDAARSTVDFVLRRPRLAADARLARVLAGLRDPARARTVLPDSGETPATRAARSHALAAILLAEGDAAGAERALRETIGELPYHVEARLELLALLIETGRAGEARAVADSSPPGMLRLGPDYQRRAGALLRGDSR
jgi:tetratricopeptide (TPR) repeat protein